MEPDIEQCHKEIVALVVAWADRGTSPLESAMILASSAHSLLAKLGVTLEQMTEVMNDAWRRNDGKLS